MSSPPTNPLVSVIIPNWNGRRHLATCLDALRAQTFDDFEVIVADNGSTDGSQELIHEQYPEVIVLPLGENRGFTGACIAGYAASRGAYVVLLNNDTEAEPGWLAAIVGAFEAQPEVGIIAGKLLLFDDRRCFHAAGDYYRTDGLPGNRGIWQEDVGQYDQTEPVFGACGAAAAYRRTMLEQIGFLDDAFFFSCEDVDLAWRAHLAGWQVLYVPSAVVYHKLKASGGSGATSSYYDGRNFLYLIWKNYPTSLLRQHWPSIVRAQWRISREALRAWRGEAARARLRGQLAGLLGWPRMLSRRRAIQTARVIDDRSLSARLTQVDGDPADG
jgi:GT2 family glycosyltransferase